MFSNYFFLKRLAKELQIRLPGMEVVEIFSQNKDELILGFADPKKEFWIRANLDPNISLLSFPETFARARKNSVNLFPSLVGQRVTGCSVFSFERSFQIEFGSEHSLIFKMHGRRANVLLAEKGKVTDLFRKGLSSDLELTTDSLHKEIEVSPSAFAASDYTPISLIPALGKEVQKHWEDQLITPDPDKSQENFRRLLLSLEENPISIVGGDKPTLSLLSVSDAEETTMDPIEASNWLYEKKVRSFYLDREKNQLLGSLKHQIKKSENYIFKTNEKLRLIQEQRNPEEIANIIMANLGLIERGLERVTLNDLYHSGLIEIKLNPKLSPQKNAENFYRKSKNRHQEIEMLQKNIREKERAIEKLEKEILTVEQIEHVKELKKHDKTQRKDKPADKRELPYHAFEFDGWDIFVGKNAKANDELTLKTANKNDLWLHAKDVSGSHVIIRQKPGQNFPKHVIEHAAGIAAFNSKRKTDSVCPVSYTPKKFIRKVKGAPPGQVVVEKEEVVIVEPVSPER